MKHIINNLPVRDYRPPVHDSGLANLDDRFHAKPRRRSVARAVFGILALVLAVALIASIIAMDASQPLRQWLCMTALALGLLICVCILGEDKS